MRNFVFMVALILFVFAGCTEKEEPRYTPEELENIPQPIRTGLPPVQGGFVLAVGTDTITGKEMVDLLLPRLAEAAQNMSYDKFAPKALPVVIRELQNKVADILLYQKAMAEAPEQIDEQLDKYVEAETRRFISSFGGDYAKAEAFLNSYYKMGWKEYRKHLRRSILSSSYLQGKLPEQKPITYSDLKKYYQDNIDQYHRQPTITIRLIDIDKQKLTTGPNQTRTEAAAKLAVELIERIQGSEDFAELAKQYSHDYRASKGGLWDPIKPDSLAKPYDILAKEAQSMGPGDITGPLDTGNHVFIMRLEDKQTEEITAFESVQKEIGQQLKMQNKIEAMNTLMSKLLEEASITGIQTFAEFVMQKLYVQAN